MKRLKQAQYQLVKFINLIVVQIIKRLSLGSSPLPIYSLEEMTTRKLRVMLLNIDMTN